MGEGIRRERSSSSHCWNVGDCWPWFWGLMQEVVFKSNLALLHRSQFYTGCGGVLVLCLGLLSPWVLAYVWRVLDSHNEMDIMCAQWPGYPEVLCCLLLTVFLHTQPLPAIWVSFPLDCCWNQAQMFVVMETDWIQSFPCWTAALKCLKNILKKWMGQHVFK